ncbi:MAG: sodium/proton-translocating pyrophosphatase [Candidatus Saccharibacteria bacterium]|nr:sodium/proton-translocating pyrophosphatase [Candidatus Saccharibacteria bacterium]
MLATIVYIGTFAVIVIALLLVACNFIGLRKRNEGREDMKELAKTIREGANAFLKREYKVIAPVAVLFAIMYSCLSERTAGYAFIFGAVLNTAAAIIGMKAQTYGNVRTTNAALVTKKESRTMRVALLGGSVGGFAVPAFGLLGFMIIFLTSGGPEGVRQVGTGLLKLSTTATLAARLECFGLGYSLIGMFSRIAGGIYTKAADISADLVGKNHHDLPEDDPRILSTIADFIGDMLNDAFGNFTDLGESYIASTVFCIVMATQLYANNPDALMVACLYPIILSAGGLLSSLIGVMTVIVINRKRVVLDENGNEVVVSREVSDIGAELALTTTVSSVVIVIVALVGAFALFRDAGMFKYGFWSPFLSAMFGVLSSVAIGKLAEYYTSAKYRHVQWLVQMAQEDTSFLASAGDFLGYLSAVIPMLILSFATIGAAFVCGGPYGLVVASVGMLSFAGTTITIDAFGPIADNAGGIAEGCHLPSDVRRITDVLDACGNTTAAIGKGNAIGSAAFVTAAEIYVYIHSYANRTLLVDASGMLYSGALAGGAFVVLFCFFLGRNTTSAAYSLADINEKEFAKEGVLEGTKKPEYVKGIDAAARDALKHMRAPALIPFLVPLLGFIFGADYVFGMMLGQAVVAIFLALFNGNSGGAWDNAKKHIEEMLALDPTNPILIIAHKASVIGDTIGDIRKDVLAVCLDIYIKIMCNEAIVLVGLFAAHHLLKM